MAEPGGKVPEIPSDRKDKARNSSRRALQATLGPDVSSEEELSRLMSKDPLFFHMDREIHPIITPEAHRKLVRELFDR